MEYAKIAQYDNLSFYKPIFILYLSMAVLTAILMSFASWIADPLQTPMGNLPNYVIPLINSCSQQCFSYGRTDIARRLFGRKSNDDDSSGGPSLMHIERTS